MFIKPVGTRNRFSFVARWNLLPHVLHRVTLRLVDGTRLNVTPAHNLCLLMTYAYRRFGKGETASRSWVGDKYLRSFTSWSQVNAPNRHI